MANRETEKQRAEDLEETIASGVSFNSTDGESTRFQDVKDQRSVLNELRQRDPAAHACGRVKPRISTFKMRGIY